MEALPYFRWLWRDWRANRRVQRMSWQARGLYRELLDEFWAEGYIPADTGELAEICGCERAEFERFWPEISPCWEPTEGGYKNAKMDSQRTAKDAERIAKASAGRRGGLACNSSTRAAAGEAIAKEMQVTAKEVSAEPDIAVAIAVAEQEQSLALTSDEVPAGDVPSKKTKIPNKTDPRFTDFKSEFEKGFNRKSELPAYWSAGCGGALSTLLKRNRNLGLVQLQRFVANWIASSSKYHTWAIERLIAGITQFQHGPLDDFGKPSRLIAPKSAAFFTANPEAMDE